MPEVNRLNSYKTFRSILLLSVIATGLVTGCSSSGSDAASSRVEHLKKNRVVAVVGVDVNILMKDNLQSLILEKLKTKFQSGESSEEALKKELEDYTVNLLNRRLSEHGFQPVQRARIKSVMGELALQQSGITTDSARIGQLVKADSILQGKLTIRVAEGLPLIPRFCYCLLPFSPTETDISFSGDITSVEQGIVLFSNGLTEEGEEFEFNNLDLLLDHWFERMPVLD